MSITTDLTLKNLTPPGYFDLSEIAPEKHRDYMSWFQQQLSFRADLSTSLTNLILTPWLVTYEDSPRVPWLDHLLRTYGFGFFGGTNSQAAFLYKLISGGWSRSTVANIKRVLDAFCLPPFTWYQSSTSSQIVSSNLVPSQVDTGFVIYSTASSLPSKPSNTAYTARSWNAPASWTRVPSSATYYCRGYLSGSNIVWCTPRPISDFSNSVYYSAEIPAAVPSAGTLCIVDADGTGDRKAVYYSDGTAWRKNSMVNADLGLITGGARPSPEAVTVWAPNPASVTYAISSATPPPADGNTQGYGSFGSWSNTEITANEIIIELTQLSGGNIAIATTIAVLRRIKSMGCTITVNIDNVEYTVSDAREAP